MLRRPLAPLITLFSAFAAMMVPLAGAAHAEGTCTFTAPARIAIYNDYVVIPAAIVGDCVPDGYAFWFSSAEPVGGFATAQYFSRNGQGAARIMVPDRLDRYGLHRWVPAGAARHSDDCRGAGTAECESLTQNDNAYSDIRLGTYAGIVGTRNSASKVTFTVTSAIWSVGSNKLINRTAKGTLQTQYADGTWHNVGNTITTGSNGKATFAVGLPQRTWRFAVYSTPYSFDRASTPITR